MLYFKLHKLISRFVFILVSLSTCSAALILPSQNIQPTPSEKDTGPQLVRPAFEYPPVEDFPEPLTPKESNSDTPSIVYLPLVRTPINKFFGIYIKQYWNDQNVNAYLPLADQMAGKKHTSVGWFIDFEDDAFRLPVTYLPANNLYRQLEELWKAGYVSFINLASRDATAAQIASGARDTEIGNAAEIYKKWLMKGEGRRAFIAPLQEMNGNWVSYGLDPENYKLAYRHIMDIFTQKGISRSQTWWIFAPNGWNSPGHEFETYYPGDDVVDFVSFSSYNYGFCPGTVKISAWWGSYSEIFEPYINRMRVMAPSKKIIIAETATSAYYAYNRSDDNRKNQWLIENYNYLASQPSVIGVYYFSFNEFDGKTCDFKIDNYQGYQDGLNNPIYQYLPIQSLNNIGP